MSTPTITAAQVKELRDRTGAGMMDCKKALEETSGDVDAAAELLRVRLGDKALKMGGREATEGTVQAYIHANSKVGVLVGLDSAAPTETLTALGKQLAMHIAAAHPLALDASGLDPDLLARERAIASDKAAESGKPANIVEKMVDGTMAKFAKENALLSQLFVIDGKTPIADVVAAAAKEAGSPISVTGFERFQLGEGIERETSDFAAEVAAAAGA